jgi:hypothetical protein
MSRQYTTQLLDLVAGGQVDQGQLIKDLLGYLSEAEVEDFAKSNGYIEEDEEDEDPEEEDEEDE